MLSPGFPFSFLHYTFFTLGLVITNPSELHLHYFKRLYLSLHEFLRCFYGSRGRVTRFLQYQLEEHS
ncbi:hypothetical protein E2C01_021112 [Portunus trituberculatus]|uniref:Uncharacterized protein n=1 Tax=Portunus trituberculatus TaxID=210409 RepID=A0A5B7E3S9_PORTR|nr:hypothetical protein [Portunus trituberculatus]